MNNARNQQKTWFLGNVEFSGTVRTFRDFGIWGFGLQHELGKPMVQGFRDF